MCGAYVRRKYACTYIQMSAFTHVRMYLCKVLCVSVCTALLCLHLEVENDGPQQCQGLLPVSLHHALRCHH